MASKSKKNASRRPSKSKENDLSSGQYKQCGSHNSDRAKKSALQIDHPLWGYDEKAAIFRKEICMDTQIKYSSTELGTLSKLEIEIPPMPRGNSSTGKTTHVFSVGKSPTKYTRETLMKKSATMSRCTDFFEKALLGSGPIN
jgi:hypothetical protein